MENKSNWGGARKGAGAPVRLADADKRKNRAIPFSDKEWAEIGRKASGKDMSKAELIRNAVFAPKKEKAWLEYEGGDKLPAIDHMEYYATDFVDWVLGEQKSEYYNLIGLVDENDQIFEEYR